MGIKHARLVSVALGSAVAVALLAGCASSASSATQGQSRQEQPADKTSASRVQSGIVKVGDANIEYFSQGEGEAVVLLPGGSLDVGYMVRLAEAVAKAGYRAVRINPRGAGKSTGPENAVTLQVLADDVAGVIKALKLQPANVGGHAFGNRVARCLAADHPELVRSVILFAAGGKVPPAPPVDGTLKVIFNPSSTEPEILGR